MTINTNGDSGQDFARAFGDALAKFLASRGMTQVDAARLLGLVNRKTGKPSKSRLNGYLHNSPSGWRHMPEAHVLYLACIKLDGFSFEHKGYRINAETIGRNGRPSLERPPEQLPLHFARQFNLTDEKGTVTENGEFMVKVRRPPGWIEVSVSLKAASSV